MPPANKSISANIILHAKHRCDVDTVPLVIVAFAFVVAAPAAANNVAIATKNDATTMVVYPNRCAIDHDVAEFVLFVPSSSSNKITPSDLTIMKRRGAEMPPSQNEVNSLTGNGVDIRHFLDELH